jgi:hypothetical protein
LNGPSQGAGEHIIRSLLAKTICERLEAAGDDVDPHEILQGVLETTLASKMLFLRHGRMLRIYNKGHRDDHPDIGVILMVVDTHDSGRFCSLIRTPNARLSRRQSGCGVHSQHLVWR